jgi:hypothetical protein
MKTSAPFEYVATHERELIAQYVRLRRRVYFAEYPWLPSDFGFEDEADREGRIVLALQSGSVAGGARLTLSTPSSPRLLPLEDAEFRISNCETLKSLALDRNPYGEISRMAVDPECSHGLEVSGRLGDELCAFAAALGADTMFCICPDKPARLNRMHAHRRGLGFARYQRVATVFGQEMWLCAFTGLRRVYAKSHQGAA